MKKIYRMYLDFGRNGALDGMFVAEEEDIKNLIGKKAYFGEVLGKHSDVSWDFEEGEHIFTEVPATSEIIQWFEENIGTQGYNPFHYVACDECNYTGGKHGEDCSFSEDGEGQTE